MIRFQKFSFRMENTLAQQDWFALHGHHLLCHIEAIRIPKHSGCAALLSLRPSLQWGSGSALASLCCAFTRASPIRGGKKHAQHYKFQRQRTLQACHRYLPQKTAAMSSGTKGSGKSQGGLQARGSCAAPGGHGLTNMPHKDATAGGKTLTGSLTQLSQGPRVCISHRPGQRGRLYPSVVPQSSHLFTAGAAGWTVRSLKLGCLRVATTSDVILHRFERGVYEEAVIFRG